jgi:hypothetical protein
VPSLDTVQRADPSGLTGRVLATIALLSADGVSRPVLVSILGVDGDTTRRLAHETPSSRNNLAGAYESAEDLGRAIGLHEQTLADMERVFGTEHPTSKVVRANRARARRRKP